MASERQIHKLRGLAADKMIRLQIALPIRTLIHHPQHQAEKMMSSSRTQQTNRGPPLMRGLGIHKNFSVSDTKLTLGLRVGFIRSHSARENCSHLTREGSLERSDELPAWDLKHACIDHQSNAYHCCTHRWPRFVHNVQPAGTDSSSKPQQDCQHNKCHARTDPVFYHKLYSN